MEDTFNRLIAELFSSLKVEPFSPSGNNNESKLFKDFIKENFYGELKELLLNTFNNNNPIEGIVNTLRKLLITNEEAKTSYDLYLNIYSDPELLATFLPFVPKFPFGLHNEINEEEDLLEKEELESTFNKTKVMEDGIIETLLDIAACLIYRIENNNEINNSNKRDIYNLTIAVRDFAGRKDVIDFNKLNSKKRFLFAYQDQVLRTVYGYAIVLSGNRNKVSLEDVISATNNSNPYLGNFNLEDYLTECLEDSEEFLEMIKLRGVHSSSIPPTCGSESQDDIISKSTYKPSSLSRPPPLKTPILMQNLKIGTPNLK